MMLYTVINSCEPIDCYEQLDCCEPSSIESELCYLLEFNIFHSVQVSYIVFHLPEKGYNALLPLSIS